MQLNVNWLCMPIVTGDRICHSSSYFLQSLDEKVWQAIEIGQTKPKEAPADWDDAKIKAANFNSKALNALFSVVTNKEFKKISSTKTAKGSMDHLLDNL